MLRASLEKNDGRTVALGIPIHQFTALEKNRAFSNEDLCTYHANALTLPTTDITVLLNIYYLVTNLYYYSSLL